MKQVSSRHVRAARAIQRAWLRLIPSDVRRAYRDEMIATFEAASADAAAHGPAAVWRLLAREIWDLATANRANRPAGVVFAVPALSDSTRATRGDWLRASAWRQAWRSLRRRPAFLTAAILTLGLGGAVTTAAFALVDTVLVKPLPFPDGDRLVTVYESSPVSREKISLIAPARLEDWRRLSRSFSALSGTYMENVTDTSGREPERLEARRVAPRFFAVFAMPPLAGRTFIDAEEQTNGPGAAVISERFWTRRFQRDPAAIGRALTIGGRPYPIVGVLPATFSGASTDLWLPVQLDHPRGLLTLRSARFLNGIGRLRPGVGVDAAARELAAVQAELAKEFPATDAGWSVELQLLKDARIGGARRGLVLVFGAVAALWLIAIANLAGLTLVQVHRRTRELAIRAALGASRARVVGTVIREGLLIAIIGGALGAGLAAWLVAAMPALLTRTPRMNELALDGRALLFAAGTSLLASCVFSLVPAIAGTRTRVSRLIAMSGRGVAGGHHRLQRLLVVGQVALSVLLVGSATLLLRSYYNLARVDTGFDATGVVTFHIGARWDEDRARIGQLQEQLLARLEQLPHVEVAGMTNFLPATGATLRYQVLVEGLAGPNADGSMTAGARMISGGYLRAIRTPLLAGTWCPNPTPHEGAPRTAMVNRRFVDVFASGQPLVGRTLRLTQRAAAPFTVVGVIGDLAEDGHGTTTAPYVYTCNPSGSWPDPEYVVRTADARALASDVRRIIDEIDPARAVFGLRPVQDVLDAALDQPRLDAAILGAFAGAALTLSAVGLYSLFMLVVSDRAREIAVRLAIGAAPAQIVRLVVTGAGSLLAGGVVLGIVLTAAADRLLRGVLFGVSPLDAPTLGVAVLVLIAVSAAAVAGPAIKAARIAPLDALRGD